MPSDTFASLPFLLFVVFFVACANPRPPTGGPPDQTPPAIESSTPASGALNVEGQRVRITFSEYVDPATLPRALSVSPPPDGPMDFRWRRRTVEIRFPEPLRDNTTYVLTFDGNLRDVHGVALRQPLTLAFSTGPLINQGQIVGRVLDAARGQAVPDIDIYAYARNGDTFLSPTTVPPDYRTQTDESGRFSLTYLREEEYFVLALRDRNRNRRLDASEPFAVPPRPWLYADSTRIDSLVWILASSDAVPPRVQRIVPLTRRSTALRFTEPARLVPPDPALWTLADSSTGVMIQVDAIYQPPGDDRQILLRTPPLLPRTHLLRPASVTDTSGNALPDTALFFHPSAATDTLRLRFLEFVPFNTDNDSLTLLEPGRHPGVRFNEPVPIDQAPALITATDTTGLSRPISFVGTEGTTLLLRFEPPLEFGEAIKVTVGGDALETDSTYFHTFRRINERDLGTLSGFVARADTVPVIVELFRDDVTAPVARTQANETGRFVFENVPEGSYRFRVFIDRDEDASWDAGRLLDYSPPEPLTWTEAPPWRARWDTALTDTLRFRPHP